MIVLQKSAKDIVGCTLSTEGLHNYRKKLFVKGERMASVKQLSLSLGIPGDESCTGKQTQLSSNLSSSMMAHVLEWENLKRALKQVKRNKGAPGIDGLTVNELSSYLKRHLVSIKAELLEGRYRPKLKLEVTIRQLTRRTRGHKFIQIIVDLKVSLLGWAGFCS